MTHRPVVGSAPAATMCGVEPNSAEAVAELQRACRLVAGVPVPEPVPVVGTGSTAWVPASRAAETVDLVGERIRAGRTGHGTVLATAMAHAQGLSYAVAGPSVAGALAAEVAVDIDPERLWLGFGRGGFCERVAAEPWQLASARPGEFEDRVAEQIVGVLEPAFENVHRVSRIGRRVIWSALPDSVAAVALTASLAGAGGGGASPAGDLCGAWRAAAALIDAVAARVPAMSARPRPVTFTFGDGETSGTWMVRGGCCFMYRLGASTGYCVTCPVLDEDGRRQRLREWAGESSLWRRGTSQRGDVRR
ncbi:(2Fe-2S)-binding protein [Haloactinopolyspora alba]|nr:(2Fe-2S)-binding protein [Haloactinopolyspora alba]